MTTTLQTSTPAVGLVDVDRPGMARLTAVEMRKMVDTRAGKWLVAVIILLYVGVAAVALLVNEPELRHTVNAFQFEVLPAGVLLPVLGVLSVTSEWSQRTTLATFTLVPPRQRTLVAKLLAVSVLAVLSVVLSVVFAAGTSLIADVFMTPAVDWSLPVLSIATALLAQVLGAVMGVGFGMLFLSSPVAIVLLFVLPTAFGAITALVPGFDGVGSWLDNGTALGALSDGAAPTAGEWARIATSSALWIALPLVAGFGRVLRSELK